MVLFRKPRRQTNFEFVGFQFYSYYYYTTQYGYKNTYKKSNPQYQETKKFHKHILKYFYFTSIYLLFILVEKSYHTKAFVCSKTSLNTGCMCGTWVDTPTCKSNTFFRSLAP